MHKIGFFDSHSVSRSRAKFGYDKRRTNESVSDDRRNEKEGETHQHDGCNEGEVDELEDN